MNRCRTTILIALALVAPGSALAGFADSAPGDGVALVELPQPVSRVAVSQRAPLPTAEPFSIPGAAISWPGVPDYDHLTGPLSESTSEAPELLHALPPAPSSFVLGLTALAGLGLYQVSQTIRRGQVIAWAEWYHTGGPQQIGHATPLDLGTLETHELPACVFDEVRPTIKILSRLRWEADGPLSHAFVALVTAPRAPPTFS